MSWSDGTPRFDVRLHGAIEFKEDLTDVTSMADDGYLTMRDWSAVIPRTIEIRSSNGVITRKFYVAGLERPFDDEARRWLAEKLPILVRRSGIGAQQRVKSIFTKKGTGGVLDEIRLLGSDYARRLYFIALLDTAQLDSTSSLPVLVQIGQLMTSDYERGQVLQHIASHIRLDRPAAQAYVRAMATMQSDYERRRVLTALAGRGSIDRDVQASVFDLVGTMHSDYDRAEVLLAFLNAHAVESASRQAFVNAAERIKSTHDQNRVLAALVRAEKK